MTDNAYLTDEYLSAAHELREITAAEASLKQRKDACKQILAKAMTIGQQGVDPTTGEVLVTMRAGARRFDPVLAQQNLPAAQYTAICTMQPDPKLAKAVLAPALYDLACKQNADSIVAA